MSDYISREAAKEAAWENIINNVVEEQGMYGYLIHLVDKVFDAIPAADVRPVVLCRDCVYAYPYGLEIKCTKHSGRADRFGEDATYSEFHEESWFCADGEERKHERKW